MKTLLCIEPGKLEYKTGEKPLLQKDHAIIKIERIGICGTDLHAFKGTQPYFSYPRILGHELAGELIEFDNAEGFQKVRRLHLFLISIAENVLPVVKEKPIAVCK